jgi:hypothetical protein
LSTSPLGWGLAALISLRHFVSGSAVRRVNFGEGMQARGAAVKRQP